MPLTATLIRNTKPREKTFKLYDERGLYLEVSRNGGKWWRLKYRFSGKEKRLSLGVYPDVSLKEARDRRDEARKLLANEIDPSENRKAQKTARGEREGNSFEVVAREWFAKPLISSLPMPMRRIAARMALSLIGRPLPRALGNT